MARKVITMFRKHEALRRKLHKKLDAVLDEKLAASGDHILTIDEMEKIVGELRDELGDTALDGLAEESAREVDQALLGGEHPERGSQKKRSVQKVECQQCGRQAHFRGVGKRTVVTLFGTMSLKRRIYYCRICDRCIMPVDEFLRLPATSYTRTVELMVGKMGALSSFQSGVKLIRELTRVDISTKQAQIVTIAVGEWAIKVLKEQAEKAAKTPEAVAEQMHRPDIHVRISADGVHTPMQGGSFKEAKVGRVRVTGPGGNLMSDSYCHHLGEPIVFGKLWYGMVAREGAAESAKTYIVTDGALWIERLARRHFQDAECILDWYHAREYLGDVAHVCFEGVRVDARGEEVTAAQRDGLIKEWVEAAKEAMWEGRFNELIDWVKKLPRKTQEAYNAVRRAVGYYTRNRGRMNYPDYRARGLEIGSGHIESACKNVVSSRMKGSGMRWREKGARAVGTLRAIYLSKDAWDPMMATWPGRAAA